MFLFFDFCDSWFNVVCIVLLGFALGVLHRGWPLVFCVF